jgi:hypothetical protein
MINLTPENLLTFLQKNNYLSEIQKDTKQAYTILKIEKKEFPLFLRVYEQGELLQLLVFIPCQLESNPLLAPNTQSAAASDNDLDANKKAVWSDMARLLHLFNKELDIPGFGMDESAGVVFYRVMIPTPKYKIDPELLLAFIKTAEYICKMFSHSIEAISTGRMSLDEIITKAKDMDTK